MRTNCLIYTYRDRICARLERKKIEEIGLLNSQIKKRFWTKMNKYIREHSHSTKYFVANCAGVKIL